LLLIAVCIVSARVAEAQATNSTQAILENPGFWEGLACIGTNEPTEAESSVLLGIVTNLSQPTWTADVEQFLLDYPDSAWAPALHHAYASFCRRTGRTTKALAHWEAAWDLVQNETSQEAKLLGGAALANWSELLCSLGRSQDLADLIAAGEGWDFANQRDRERFQVSKDAYQLMLAHPDIAFRCGTFALKGLGQHLQPTNDSLEILPEVSSPTNGFSLAELLDLSQAHGLDLVAVRRGEAATNFIAPSLIHWQQNHYAAILDQQDDLYLVADPTFGRPLWMTYDA